MIKYLVLFFLCAQALACNNFIAESEITAAIALAPSAGALQCGGKGADKCICFDGIYWSAAVYRDGVLSNDAARLADKRKTDQDAKDVRAIKDAAIADAAKNVKEDKASDEDKDLVLKALAEKL